MKYSSETKIFCIALSALVFSLILVPVGYAAIGVKEGDWAKYRIEAEVPEEMAGMEGYEMFEQLDWVKLEVQSVSGTSVTSNMTLHFKNGTEDTETTPGTGFIIDTDLGEGDTVTNPLFGSGTPMEIAGSKQQTYAGASREVNYVDFDLEQEGISYECEACWDKATGMLCEMVMSISGEIMGQTVDMSVSIEMIETNLWAAELLSGQWLWIFIVVVIIVAGVVVGSAVLLLRRRKAPLPPEVAPASTE